MNSINLNQPFTLTNGQVIKNRLFKSAMSEQLGDKHQMWRIADGKDADPQLSAFSVVLKTLISAGWYAFKKRRA
ncbi:hypothetical protein [Aliivibrio fischeri]|uniref:hypothetical protein n=1 Tax=Aliivibrio fischeri TaxID=668 RepID=UPI0007C4C199|nr:hypothetical protein [Aliivibrio fischeri]MCE7555297.1 hypothetical protein [Aliivibrio fischeri]MCE7562565.1 hypothetical protein [Aliivibrio fischeri]MCE7569973.1 hypothetical protein [Aliivibrio fischeri]TDM52010.1 hypothetical protein VFFQA001_18075 [Aliivibrio fischeri]